MAVSAENKMKITCSECSSHYSMSRGDISALPYSIMNCSTCRQKIKIIICPRCSSCYTVTFGAVNSPRYMMTCRRCSHNFVVSFPPVKSAAGVSQQVSPKKESAGVEFFQKTGNDRKQAKVLPKSRVVFPPERNTGNRVEKKSEYRQPAESSPMPGSFELSEIIDCITGAFSFSRLAAGFAGILVMMVSYKLMEGAGLLLQGVPVLGALRSWISAGLLFSLHADCRGYGPEYI